ncbi:MAG TPA: DUF2589 domain-containing protein [Pyrinomonadaceae bacterium]|jgi:hypothetical protein|nr:DUF2589 domain-containing protein [Pyrinomonadaceae bacterium]
MATNPGTELATLDFGNLIGGPLVAVITAQALAARSTADFIKTVGFNPAGQLDPDGNDIGGTPVYVDFKYPKETQPFQPAVIGVTAVSAVPAIGNSAFPQGMAPQVTVANGGAANDLDPAHVLGLPVFVPAVSAVVGVTAKAAIPAVYQDMKFSVPILTMLPIPFIKIDSMTLDFNAKISSVETASESSDLAISGSLEVQQRWPSGRAKLNVSCAYKKSTTSGSSVERTYSMAVHVQASQDEMPAGMEKLLNILEGAMLSVPA